MGNNKPCYDDHRSMVRWVKGKDGSWDYDYTVFDQYVGLAMDCGITRQINAFSLLPLANEYSWYDETSGKTVFEEIRPGSEAYEDPWQPFLRDFSSAGFYHESIDHSIYDYSSTWRDWGRIPTEKILERKKAGLITTYYAACGIPKPNNFTFSPPAESC